MNRDSRQEIAPIIVIGVVLLFFALVYLAVVLYRRFRKQLGWLDALLVTSRDPRIVCANRVHRRDDVESTPRRATIVRFNIDGKVLSPDDD